MEPFSSVTSSLEIVVFITELHTINSSSLSWISDDSTINRVFFSVDLGRYQNGKHAKQED
jgi:hypothetical protein